MEETADHENVFIYLPGNQFLNFIKLINLFHPYRFDYYYFSQPIHGTAS